MRIGVYLPTTGTDGRLDARGVEGIAREIEDVGIDSLWMGDHIPIPGVGGLPDPLLYLATAARGTEGIELGTGIYNVVLREKYDMAQRLYSFQTLAPGRLTLGVGTGSQEREYIASGISWKDRFTRLHENMAGIRLLFSGRPDEDSEPNVTWASSVGPPRFLLGAWFSEPQLTRAATEFQGWLVSSGLGARGGGWRKVFTEGLKRYRDLGGGRAIVSTVSTDLSATDTKLDDDGPFRLFCPPEVAADRIHELEEMGFDDIILMSMNSRVENVPGQNRRVLTRGDFELIRSLAPRDTRDYHKV
jgi:alkanesulfonate monooxygenase SsuD/methylene tetrahydromethanopterin reductase-like flavin-dependent oxidoreductase (luciferase family)